MDWLHVTRQVGENAVEVQVGIEWTLPDANAWLEFSNMELASCRRRKLPSSSSLP